MRNLILLFLLVASAAISCKSPMATSTSQSKPQITTPKHELLETYWKLTELNGKAVVTDTNMKKEIHILFKIEGNRVQGFAGCNNIMGTYELLEGNRIKFSGMATTMMACPNMATEAEFNKMLNMVDNYTVNGKTMSLAKARMAPMARFEAVYLK